MHFLPLFSSVLLLLSTSVAALSGPLPTVAPQTQSEVHIQPLQKRQDVVEQGLITTTIRLDGTLTTLVIQPSPTATPGCYLHGSHWDCPTSDSCSSHDEHDHSHAGHSHAGHSHAGHSHAGHSHGPSEEYGCGLAPLGEYRVGIHVGAIFIILIASALGVGLPIVLQRHPDAAARSSTGFLSKVISESFFVLKHASYGIIVAVCFVHLLIHAFIYLGNECVQPLAYEATAASITMGGVLFVFIVDFLLLHSIRRKAAQAQDAVTQAHSASASPTKGEVAECGILDPEATGSIGDETLAEDVRQAKANMQVFELLIFELSILLHSVIIGVTLGASDGSGWSTLLIAVVFHQLFEGFALGARIAELPHRVGGPLKKFLMATAFALITPVGIAIGMGSRYSWNPNDRSTLLVMGILQSISAGALLWSALVEMIAGDYLYGPMARASLGRGMVGIISLLIGAVLMSVLAQWA